MEAVSRARIVLVGIEDALAAELAGVLEGESHDLFAEPELPVEECLSRIRQIGADVVFCAAEGGRYLALLDGLKRDRAKPSVIVVSHTPEVAEWLDAIEAGASDYCAAPFEPGHIRWILDSSLKGNAEPILYRAAG